MQWEEKCKAMMSELGKDAKIPFVTNSVTYMEIQRDGFSKIREGQRDGSRKFVKFERWVPIRNRSVKHANDRRKRTQ